MTNAQMELEFATSNALTPAPRHQRRMQRAAWWFNQMRQAVDRAFESAQGFPPRPAHFAPPTQTCLAGTHREIRA